jgi:hypothetical protein
MVERNQYAGTAGTASVASSVGPPKALGESEQFITSIRVVLLLTECRHSGRYPERAIDRVETAGGDVHRRSREVKAHHSAFRRRIEKR